MPYLNQQKHNNEQKSTSTVSQRLLSSGAQGVKWGLASPIVFQQLVKKCDIIIRQPIEANSMLSCTLPPARRHEASIVSRRQE